MADYWKSQPKKFCQYCKCWIADNKPSVDFHERGKNHKENVELKIAEIKKRSLDKAKQEDRQSKEFAAMEEAAQKAYEEDMKRLGIDPGPPAPTKAPAQTQPPAETKPPPQPKPPGPPKNRKEKRAGKARRAEGQAQPYPGHAQPEGQAWVEACSDEGVTYYYNTLTGESGWERPQGFQEERSSSTAQPGHSDTPGVWKEAQSPDGYTYYYNTETAETSWERPAGLPVEGSGSRGEPEGQAEETETGSQPGTLPAGEESSRPAEAGDSTQPSTPKVSTPKVSIPKVSIPKKRQEEKESGGEEDIGDGGKEGDGEGKEAVAKDDPPVAKEDPPAKKPRKTPTPYGAWEQIQVEENPYEKIDLQLPQVEGGPASGGPPPAVRPPAAKPQFKERTITSLGDQGGPASFRKRKPENGKGRSLRQRDADD